MVEVREEQYSGPLLFLRLDISFFSCDAECELSFQYASDNILTLLGLVLGECDSFSRSVKDDFSQCIELLLSLPAMAHRCRQSSLVAFLGILHPCFELSGCYSRCA